MTYAFINNKKHERGATMKTLKVIIYGMGAVGQQIVKCLDTKPGIEVVGAIDLRHVGEDIGELSGLGKKLNVCITDDADKLFSETEADVVFHLTTTTVADCVEQLRKPISEGIQILTSAEEMVSPFYYNKEGAEEIDALAKKHNVSVLGSGLWPTYMDVYIPVALSGGCREVERIEYRRHSDFSAYIGSKVLTKFALDMTKDEYEKALADGQEFGHTGFGGTFQIFADLMGWNLEKVVDKLEPFFDEDGNVISLKHSATGICDGKEKIYNEIWASIQEDWVAEDSYYIKAIPEINVTINGGIKGTVPVANCIVNQLPMLLKSEPGIIDMPIVGMRAFDGNIFDQI